VTTRFYPVLLTHKGPLRWEARVLDFAVWGKGNTMQNAESDATEALQAEVDAIEDHQELPHPSHRLVAEHELVLGAANGWALIGVRTKLESDIDMPATIEPPKKEKSSASKHQGKKKVRRS
jgi:hypothetical protein